ncbi:MAG TPA: flagellar basal body P-ring protein FlgI [Candidatus Sulfotelmatobacter sp.]|nr:flagellar basal body P-ring protein FlgI [Candidatus Sulfotelmatobacter sp.]HWI57388.1 flagellar basal body P-ring protein FlgI [Bacillota bacterium]
MQAGNPFQASWRRAALLLLLTLCTVCQAMAAGVRVRDFAMVAGARDNQLVGYGLVVGLAGDGDKDPVYTKQTIANLLQRYGINVPPTTLSAKNVAVVMVTADIPAFLKPGARLDVQVASMGDAKSIQGGVLLQTPLLGADNKVYAVAQGPVSIGGFTAGPGGGGGATVTKNHPTAGQIINGALVEKEIPTTIVRDNSIELLLREPGFTSAARLTAAINEVFTNCAHAVDATAVQVRMPEGAEISPVDFIARLEGLEVIPDTPARIIINERTGTIVATSRIRISSCAVSHGNITINVASTLDVSQPNPLSNKGSTVVTPRTSTQVTETKSSLVALPELPTVEKIAAALNALGVTPRDMMAIFEAMKQAGALQAELIIR